MVSENGHHNGIASVGVGGDPGSIAGDVRDPNRKRSTYRLLERAINIALSIPEEAMRAAWESAVVDLKDQDGRVRARAREFMVKVQDSGIASALGLDKIERLDRGDPTEEHRHRDYDSWDDSRVEQYLRERDGDA